MTKLSVCPLSKDSRVLGGAGNSTSRRARVLGVAWWNNHSLSIRRVEKEAKTLNTFCCTLSEFIVIKGKFRHTGDVENIFKETCA